jgi:UDP-2,3-diacylglucosamine pyrophosphatase LpxH
MTAPLVSLMLALVLASMALSWQASTGNGRLVIVIGDLHMGPGKDPKTGQWHPLEDFRWGDDFAAFLRAVNQAGNGATDLVLNGDTFELWQSTTPVCQHTEARLGCTEAEALTLLDRILAAHAPEISDLGAFARGGTNRVILVPGNHDAALLFPALAKRAADVLNAPGRVEVSARGYWSSSDGSIYVEHGHQMPSDPYRFASWPEPFLRQGGQTYLERTWGEQLIQGIYNEHEPRFPILDNIAEEGIGLKYAVAADPKIADRAGVAPLLKFFVSRMPWQQFRQDLDGGAVEAPEWDVPAIRRSGAAFFTGSLLPDDRFRPLADRALADARLQLDPGELSDTEIVAVCDYRAALRRARRRNERMLTQVPFVGPSIVECPRLESTRGPEFDYFWRSRNARFKNHLDQAAKALRGPIKVFVYGHTHLPDRGFIAAREGNSPLVLSPGAWQRTITPFQVDELMKNNGWSELDALSKLQPEQLPACYGVVWIDPYTLNPNPRLRFWRHDGKWGALARDAVGTANACAAGGGGVP